jgi:hypothetical protein
MRSPHVDGESVSVAGDAKRPLPDDKPVLLNLPRPLLDQVNLAVRKQGVSRTHFLRQAIERNLRHYMRHYKSVERAVFARIYRQGMS